ncbi:MAG: M48 family metalloprotease [Candidatus Hydrogenedentes bacterium]|nr:M48 family metalloprotease [Candidatus Hydrogenedentota bacterium]
MKKQGAFFAFAAALLLCGTTYADDVTPWVSIWVYPDSHVFYEIGMAGEPSRAAYAEVTKAFGPPLDVTPPSGDDRFWTIAGECPGAATRHAFMIKGAVPMAPLMELARGSTGGEVDVEIGCRNSPVHRVSWPGLEEYPDRGWRYVGKTLSATEDLTPLEFEFGFPLWRVLLYPVTAVALVTALIAYLVRRRNDLLQRAAEDPTAAWFNYYLAGQKVFFAGVMAVLIPPLLVDPGEFVGFITGAESRLLLSSISLATMLAPYLVLVVLATAVAYPVYTHVRGAQVTRRDLVLQGLLGTLMWSVPLFLVYVSLISLFQGMFIGAAILALCSAGSLLLLMNLWWKTFRVRRERLTECPLRERINSLAEKAGVKLKDIQILTPAIRMFSANAFTLQGGKLVLTDCLVDRLTTREVDAIVGHELGHTRRRHPEKKVRFSLAGGVIWGVVLGAGTALPGLSTVPIAQDLQWALFCFLGLWFWLLFSRAISRRNERQADADAIELTGDP